VIATNARSHAAPVPGGAALGSLVTLHPLLEPGELDGSSQLLPSPPRGVGSHLPAASLPLAEIVVSTGRSPFGG
jgi:hypothetical protein